MTQPILIAGAAGFIGSHLCDRLLAEGHQVIGVDNLQTGRLGNLAGALDQPGFRFVEHDITAPLPEFGAVSAIYHLASPASPADFASIPLEILEVGSNGTKHLLQLAQRQQVRLLFASTSEIYGDPLEHPQTEDYHGNVDPTGPRSCYDEAKRFGEALVSAYRRHRGVDTVIIRIFNTYGPRMRPDDGRVLATFITQALRGEPVTLFGDGSQTRSFCFVTDEVSGIVAAMSSDASGPFNIGNPSEVTMRELAEMVLRVTGSASDIITVSLPAERRGDPVRRRPDITRARSQLGWNPSITLEEGLAVMIAATRVELGLAG